jgi:hypothetical protein
VRTLTQESLRWTRSCPRTGGVLYAERQYTAQVSKGRWPEFSLKGPRFPPEPHSRKHAGNGHHAGIA